MLQPASISAATVYDPELVLADEPTSALDAELADGVLLAVRQASRSLLLISHDLRLVENHADRIAVLRDGRIVETGRTGSITSAPNHECTRQLLAAADAIRSAPRSADDAHRSPGTPPVVVIDRVSVSYRSGSGTIQALRGASLTVHAGELLRVTRQSGVAIALVSHDEALLAAVADRIVRVRAGQTTPAARPDDIPASGVNS
jgi:peptide/nickel transport system ATP-binding protein